MAAKVYAILTHAPSHWPVEASANGGRQVRAVAAVPSKAAFQRLLASHGLNTSLYEVGQSASVTGNQHEVEAAMSQPGVLFRGGATSDRFDNTYVPAEMSAR